MKVINSLSTNILIRSIMTVGVAVTLLISCGKKNQTNGGNIASGQNPFGTQTFASPGFSQLESRPCVNSGMYTQYNQYNYNYTNQYQNNQFQQQTTGQRIRRQFQETIGTNSNFTPDGIYLGSTLDKDVVMIEKRGNTYAISLSLCPKPGLYDNSTPFTAFKLVVTGGLIPANNGFGGNFQNNQTYGQYNTFYNQNLNYSGYPNTGFGGSGFGCNGQGSAEVDVRWAAGNRTFIRPFSGLACF